MLLLIKQTKDEGKVIGAIKAADKESLLQTVKENLPNPQLIGKLTKAVQTGGFTTEFATAEFRWCLMNLGGEDAEDANG